MIAALTIALVLTAVAHPAHAEGWIERKFAKFRLLAGKTSFDRAGKVLVGVDIGLKPGWQFYFKNPGKYGVAPKFDWSTSKNISDVMLYWPEPSQFIYSKKPLIRTLGYKNSLLLPVQISAARNAESANIRLSLSYAVCKEVCIVDTVGLELALPVGEGENSPHHKRIYSALRQSMLAP